MKFVTIAAVCAAFLMAPVANAASLNDCIQMGKKAVEAINAAQPGEATTAAKVQAQAGQTYCASSMYNQGVARYSKALQLLGKA